MLWKNSVLEKKDLIKRIEFATKNKKKVEKAEVDFC